MKELYSEIEIEASVEKVWDLLVDFTEYPKWNPFIRSVRGEAKVGERLVVRLQPSGARGMVFRPRVLKVQPYRELRWRGRLLLPGLFDGEHIFTMRPLGEGRVYFVQREIFTGLLVPLLKRTIDVNTRRGFTEMNYALKMMAEQDIRERKYA